MLKTHIMGSCTSKAVKDENYEDEYSIDPTDEHDIIIFHPPKETEKYIRTSNGTSKNCYDKMFL